MSPWTHSYPEEKVLVQLIKVDLRMTCFNIILFFAGEAPVVEVPSLFVILSVCSLMALIVLIANCVSCCKDPEIDFKVSTDGMDI